MLPDVRGINSFAVYRECPLLNKWPVVHYSPYTRHMRRKLISDINSTQLIEWSHIKRMISRIKLL